MDLKLDRATESWREDARCRGTDAMLFFPAGRTGESIGAIAAAKAVCRSCAVQEPCLEYAVATNQETGIWGGRSEDERRVLRNARRTPHPSS